MFKIILTKELERILIEIAYNGYHYHGWQTQENAKTVQETIETNINIIIQSKENINIIGCGRTDTGVHAEQYFFHFDLKEKFNFDNFLHKINQLLPLDILFKKYCVVKPDFHARFSAVSRTYEYRVTKEKDPFSGTLYNYIKHKIDVDLMNECCYSLASYKDFTSFSKVHTDVNNFNCDIFRAEWKQINNKITFTICANRFLRNMVRAIVGTMLLVGRNKISVEDFCTIIESKNRSLAGPSVKAKALFLTKVEYPNT